MNDAWAPLKPALRRTLLNNGIAAHAVDEVVDLSCHAAQEASEAFVRVLRSASSTSVAACTAGIGASLAEAKFKDLQAMLAKDASSLGMNLTTVKLDLGS